MKNDVLMPVTANLTAVLVLFATLILVFHLVFVPWRRMTRLAWKRVDSIWLGFGALALISAVSQVRMTSASLQMDIYEHRTAALDLVKYSLDFNASSPGVICRRFTRWEYSPAPEEFQRIQTEYDAVCATLHVSSVQINDS